MALKITSHESDGISVLALDGRIVLGEETVALREKVKGLLGEGKKKLVLDLKNVSMIDSSGLGALVAAHSSAKSGGAALRLCNLDREPTNCLADDPAGDCLRSFQLRGGGGKKLLEVAFLRWPLAMFHRRRAARAFPAQLYQTGRGPLSGPPCSLRLLSAFSVSCSKKRGTQATKDQEKHREAGLVERIGNNEFNLIVPRAAQHFQRVRQQFRNRVERLDRASWLPGKLTISTRPRIPATARDSAARDSFFCHTRASLRGFPATISGRLPSSPRESNPWDQFPCRPSSGSIPPRRHLPTK